MSSNYYNINTILRRNAVISVCCGGRGIGKSYSAKVRLVRDWIDKGWQFVYVRRYRDDLASFKTFFGDIAHEFPEWEFEVKDGKARGRRAGTEDPWETLGYGVALSVSHKLKSASFPKVHWMLFDEFIAPPESRYVSNELTVFYELYSTLDRYQDRVRVIMLANAIALDNPYFNNWGFVANTEYERYGGNFVVCHYPKAEAFNNHILKSKFGKFIANNAVEYANYAMGNQFGDRSDAFIMPVPKGSRPSLAIRTPEIEITLYYSDDTRSYYVKLGLAGKERICVNCTPREGELPAPLSSEVIGAFKRKWFGGSLFFESNAARAAFRKLL